MSENEYNSLVLRRLTIQLLTLLPLLFLLPSFMPANATYDPLSVPNNRFGIHILDTSELSKAAQFVNSSDGDWGYVTIPIRANERDIDKWTKFMEDCKKSHIIPILRIATFPKDDHWMAPNEWDLIDFANFLNDLPWPIQNRYIIIYNEPNHQGEWGGFVDPEEYARVLDRAVDIFHKRNADFFVISAGLDSAAPNGSNTMNAYQYLRSMENRYRGIFAKVDGFSSHSYGNPGMTSPPNLYSNQNIANFRFEQNFLRSVGVENPKIFITEAGWRTDLIGDDASTRYYKHAFENVWADQNIVAVTPFLLTADSGPFEGFSFTRGDFKPFAKELMTFQKTTGRPTEAVITKDVNQPSSTFQSADIVNVSPKKSQKFANLFQKILNILHII